MRDLVVFTLSIKSLDDTPFELAKTLLDEFGLSYQEAKLAGKSFDKRYEDGFFDELKSFLEKNIDKNILCLEHNAYLSLKETAKKFSLDAKILFITEFLEKHITKDKIKYDFKDFCLGIYKGDAIHTRSCIKDVFDAKVAKLQNACESDGYGLLEFDADIALNLAGDVLYEAKDSGCELLVVDDIRSFYIFDALQKKIQKIKKRPLDEQGLAILSSVELLLLGLGKVDMFPRNSHKIKASFI